MFVMVGIESGEVARRGVSGRAGRKSFAGRTSRASSLPWNGGDGGSCTSSGCSCESCMTGEAIDGLVTMVFVSFGAILVQCWKSRQS